MLGRIIQESLRTSTSAARLAFVGVAAPPRSGKKILGMLEKMPIMIERLTIPGPAGPLEALLEWDPERPAPLAVLVCHPHPLFGGTMHNKVVYRAAKGALVAGAVTLRFNFRGVGNSGGGYDSGIGERDDARAALDYLSGRFPTLPLAMIGFSFGSLVALAVGASDERVRWLVGLGLPVESSDFSFLGDCRKPKLIVQGTMDPFGPREKLKKVFDTFAEPKELRWVEGVDHFFTGKLEEVQSAVEKFLAGAAKRPK
jgi:alpha/beta superfamily hydrolase